MSNTGVELAKLQLQPGDVIVVRQAEQVPIDKLMGYIQKLCELEVSSGPHQLVVLPYGVDLSAVSEADMAAGGWVRKVDDEQ